MEVEVNNRFMFISEESVSRAGIDKCHSFTGQPVYFFFLFCFIVSDQVSVEGGAGVIPP